MAEYIQVFFSSSDDKETVARRVSSVVGARLDPSDKPYADYWGQKGEIFFDLKFGHDLEDAGGIPFERMPYVLTVRGYRGDEEKHEAEARAAFERLKSLRYRPLYLVWGVEKIIDHAEAEADLESS
jgi:hypothetical protein